MVQRDIAARGVSDQRVLDAFRSVPRERFVPARLARHAYDDRPLPIGNGQTISQPYIVAVMVAAAELDERQRALEIGTGSGYGAAVLGQIAGEVWTIERNEALASKARGILEQLGCDNIHVEVGDGTLGWPAAAPFDAIVVTAGGPRVPADLREQLIDGGRLVIPVGPDRSSQTLIRVRRDGSRYVEDDLGLVRFVPLIGTQGWPKWGRRGPDGPGADTNHGRESPGSGG